MALPQTLGRLTLLQYLSSDTYTVSWLYHDPERGGPVVVRALADGLAQHPQARADFVGGSGPFQTLTSPQYAAVLDSGQAPDGTPYVVTPYAPTAVPPPFHAFGAPPGPLGPPSPGPSGQPRRRWPLVVGIVVLALVVAVGIGFALAFVTRGSTDSTPPLPGRPSAQPSGPANPSAPGSTARPAVGQCRDLADRSVPLPSDSTPVVDCSQTHTTQTYFVGRYPAGESKPSTGLAGATCQKQLGAGLGVTQRSAALSAYQVVFFGPDAAQWAAGARWFRCDVALIAGTHLLPLPSTLMPKPLPTSLQGCLTQQGAPTPCDQAHLLRAFATFVYTGSKAPSTARGQAQGKAKCPSGTAYATPPTADDVKHGYRIGVCWQTEGQPGSAT